MPKALPVAVTLAEIDGIRKKSKSAVTLSNEEQALLDGDMALIAELVEMNLEVAKKMILGGQSVNVADESGASVVQTACKSIGTASQKGGDQVVPEAHVDFVSFLVEQKAFVDYTDSYGKRPINAAIEGGDSAVALVEFLVSLKTADGGRAVNLTEQRAQDGNTLLHDAAWVGNTAAMAVLLKTGAFGEMLETMNKQGQTPLHVAAFRSPKTVVTLLIDAGADNKAVEKNPRRLSKETPDLLAEKMGRMDTAKYLRDLDTTVNAIKFAAKMKKGASATAGPEAAAA